MAYIVSFLVSVLMAYYVPKNLRKGEMKTGWRYIRFGWKSINRRILILASCIGPILVSAFRYGIGTDYFYTYIPQFNLIARGGESYYEIGFYLFNKFVALFTSDGQWLIALCSIITIGVCYGQLFKQSKTYILSITLFYLSYNYFISLNNIRQSLASAILLVAIECLINGEKIKFVAWVLIASTIHRVSIVFILLIVFDKMFFSAITYFIMSCVMFGIAKIIAPRLIAFLARYIPRLSLYMQASELAIYTKKTIGISYITLQFLIFLILIYLENNQTEVSHKDNMEWNLTKMIQCLLMCVVSMDGIVPAAYRIVRIFAFSQFILIPNAIYKHEKNKNRKRIIWFIILGLYTFWFVYNYIQGTEQVFPYKSIFNKQS